MNINKVRNSDKNNSKVKTKKYLSRVVLLFMICSIFTLMTGCFMGTPENKKNLSTTDVKMEMSVYDSGFNSKPIIRTYTEEEYKKLDKKELIDVKNIVNGSIEGEIPRNILEEGKDIIKFTFEKNGKKMKLDNTPKIKLELHPSLMMPYKEDVPYDIRYVESELKEDDDNTYSYKMERYVVQEEKYFIQLSFIEVRFELEGKKYVGITALQSSNLEEREKFFENETLPEPLAPEV